MLERNVVVPCADATRATRSRAAIKPPLVNLPVGTTILSSSVQIKPLQNISLGCRKPPTLNREYQALSRLPSAFPSATSHLCGLRQPPSCHFYASVTPHNLLWPGRFVLGWARHKLNRVTLHPGRYLQQCWNCLCMNGIIDRPMQTETETTKPAREEKRPEPSPYPERTPAPPPPTGSPSPEHHSSLRSYLIILAVFVVIGVGAGLLIHKRNAATARAASMGANQPAVPVVLGSVVQKSVPIYLDGLGTVQAYNTVTVHTRVDGQLKKVAYHRGSGCSQQRPARHIDPAPYQTALDQAIGKKGSGRSPTDQRPGGFGPRDRPLRRAN